jgi:hypothetical protein
MIDIESVKYPKDLELVISKSIGKYLQKKIHPNPEKDLGKQLSELIDSYDYFLDEDLERVDALETFLARFEPENMYPYILQKCVYYLERC